jgi:hypothetical protein
MKKLICLLFGHTPVKGLFETPEVICSKGCKRCGVAIMSVEQHWKGVRSAPPPGSSKDEWGEWCDEKESSLREKYASQADD